MERILIWRNSMRRISGATWQITALTCHGLGWFLMKCTLISFTSSATTVSCLYACHQVALLDGRGAFLVKLANHCTFVGSRCNLHQIQVPNVYAYTGFVAIPEKVCEHQVKHFCSFVNYDGCCEERERERKGCSNRRAASFGYLQKVRWASRNLAREASSRLVTSKVGIDWVSLLIGCLYKYKYKYVLLPALHKNITSCSIDECLYRCIG